MSSNSCKTHFSGCGDPRAPSREGSEPASWTASVARQIWPAITLPRSAADWSIRSARRATGSPSLLEIRLRGTARSRVRARANEFATDPRSPSRDHEKSEQAFAGGRATSFGARCVPRWYRATPSRDRRYRTSKWGRPGSPIRTFTSALRRSEAERANAVAWAAPFARSPPALRRSGPNEQMRSSAQHHPHVHPGRCAAPTPNEQMRPPGQHHSHVHSQRCAPPRPNEQKRSPGRRNSHVHPQRSAAPRPNEQKRTPRQHNSHVHPRRSAAPGRTSKSDRLGNAIRTFAPTAAPLRGRTSKSGRRGRTIRTFGTAPAASTPRTTHAGRAIVDEIGPARGRLRPAGHVFLVQARDRREGRPAPHVAAP
jgi:hypothetical protein